MDTQLPGASLSAEIAKDISKELSKTLIVIKGCQQIDQLSQTTFFELFFKIW